MQFQLEYSDKHDFNKESFTNPERERRGFMIIM